jgi:hypothetical protein
MVWKRLARTKEGGAGAFKRLTKASQGAGPLLQRDYWAVIDKCRLNPHQVMDCVRHHFEVFPPEELLRFERDTGRDELQVGDVLKINMRLAGRAEVKVVHADANSLTLCTMEGHPESGRITFGAYRNGRNDVIFHIRSRARSSSQLLFAGFLTAGEPMQTNTWTDFIDRLAHMLGEGVIGYIRAEINEMDSEDDNTYTPTFIAHGN